MHKGIYTIKSNIKIAADVYEMVLSGDTSAITMPGQFINILLPEKYLRRPISICDWSEDTITIVYKVVGGGTAQMATMPVGTELDCLVGLGTGFDTKKSEASALLLGGGVGTPPMYGLAKALLREGKEVTVLLGFNSKDDVFYQENFEALGAKVVVATADGSFGTRGFVTDILPENKDVFYYTCGPIPMLKAIYKALGTKGQISLEERMGCGFGACMGCSMQTKVGNKRVCKEGPVFDADILLWE